MMNDNSSLDYSLSSWKNSELLDAHNKKFFSEFELLTQENHFNEFESYYSILDKVFLASNSFLIQTDYSGSITKILFVSKKHRFNHSNISVGNKIFDLFNQTTRERIIHNIYLSINKKSVRTIEVTLNKNGIDHIYELLIFPSIGRELIFYFQQVTDKKKVEDSLKRADKLLKSIWNNSFDAMQLSNKKGIVIAVNKALCKMLGIRAEEIIGKPYTNIYHFSTEKSEKIEYSLWETTANVYTERELCVKNGKQMLVNIMQTFVIDVLSTDNNNIQSQNLLLSVFRDLTEKVRNENKIRDTEKLAIFGKMSAYLAHQIKTPLATIKMNLDLLEKSQIISGEKIRSYKIISEEIERLSKLIQNAFLLLRRSNNIEIDINLNELINSIENFYELMLKEKGIEFLNETTKCEVRGDYQKIRMIFILLIENSIEAINGKGYIRVKDEKDKNGARQLIYIEDSGVGIIDSSSIFETFYTTKSNGTGLGLSIVKNLLSEIGGSLKLISTEKGKTIFRVTLPLKEL